MKIASILLILILSNQATAQWRWYLQAEVGANKQEIQQVGSLVQQAFDPQSFWKSTAGGEVQFAGTPEQMIKKSKTHTAKFLAIEMQ